VAVISASLFGIASALPASARQTAQQTQAQKRYEAWATCRREADSAAPLSGMISEQALMNHYLAMSNCLSQHGYNVNVSEGGTVGPPD